MSFETSIEQWQDGERRLAEAPPFEQDVLERVTARIVAELRRRLGGAFTAEELVELYEQGHGWCVDLAVTVAPEQPYAWDARIVPTRRSPATCAARWTSPAAAGASRMRSAPTGRACA